MHIKACKCSYCCGWYCYVLHSGHDQFGVTADGVLKTCSLQICWVSSHDFSYSEMVKCATSFPVNALGSLLPTSFLSMGWGGVGGLGPCRFPDCRVLLDVAGGHQIAVWNGGMVFCV